MMLISDCYENGKLRYEVFDANLWPLYMRQDINTRNRNVEAGNTLCDWCDGTGNELWSMYRPCSMCGATGAYEPHQRILIF